jgi:hypothetical protein
MLNYQRVIIINHPEYHDIGDVYNILLYFIIIPNIKFVYIHNWGYTGHEPSPMIPSIGQ